MRAKSGAGRGGASKSARTSAASEGASLSPLAREIRKKQPFESPAVEAFLSVMRTASALGGPVERLLKGHDLSAATYNVLRILRGAWAAGLEHGRACHEIGEHMVAQVPDVTRLVDRLVDAGFVERTRCEKDRRVVYVRITKAGLDLLARIDRPLLDLHAAQLGHLTQAEIAGLCGLLARVREGERAPGEPREEAGA